MQDFGSALDGDVPDAAQFWLEFPDPWSEVPAEPEVCEDEAAFESADRSAASSSPDKSSLKARSFASMYEIEQSVFWFLAYFPSAKVPRAKSTDSVFFTAVASSIEESFWKMGASPLSKARAFVGVMHEAGGKFAARTWVPAESAKIAAVAAQAARMRWFMGVSVTVKSSRYRESRKV